MCLFTFTRGPKLHSTNSADKTFPEPSKDPGCCALLGGQRSMQGGAVRRHVDDIDRRLVLLSGVPSPLYRPNADQPWQVLTTLAPNTECCPLKMVVTSSSST